MKYLLSDNEIRKLESREELQEYLDFRKENDEWVIPYVNEMAVVGILNEPLNISSYCKEKGIEETDASMECINDTGLFLTLPKDGKMQIFPTRFTAFNTMCKRAGIAGPIVSLFKESGGRKPLPILEKAAYLTRGMSLNEGKSKVLIRDEKISACLSGKYEILPAWELIEILENQLKQDHPDFTFKKAEISHEYLMCMYYLNDMESDGYLKALLDGMNVHYNDVKVGVCFATSDVGFSQVFAYPFYEIDNIVMRLGEKLGVRHDSNNTVNDFALKIENLGMIFKESEELVEELGNIEINDLAGCVRRIAEENETIFPKTYADEVVRELQINHEMKGLAIEVYIALTTIIEKYKVGKSLSPTRYLELSEKTAKFLKCDFTQYDIHN